MKFMKDSKCCDCHECDPLWGEYGSLIEMIGLEDYLLESDYTDMYFSYVGKGPENATKFPYQKGTVIDNEVLLKIHEWELKSRSLCTIHPLMYLLIAMIKIHIGYLIV